MESASGGPRLDDGSPFYARTRLPTEHGEFDVRVYVGSDGKEHLAISVGELSGAESVPCRVHSECLTGEVLGSLKCDCKPQLDAALQYIQREGRGVVLYLRQEGRGIGLGNKIRAYHLQEHGADTVEANRLLGFEDDLRTYETASEMLAALGVGSVMLLTNNPSKLTGLEEVGVRVAGRVPLVTGINEVNRPYLETKRVRMGHLLKPVLLAPVGAAKAG
jgi:GTP cyclohydrolase II